MKITKENIKEKLRSIMKEESEYQIFFRKALEKAGKSIPSMSDEEKKAFFNKIDATWDGKGEKNEELTGKQHKLDIDGDGEIEASDLAALRAGKKKEESVNEGVSPKDMDKIKGAVEAASSFMSVGSELKKLGMKYTFATEPLPIYIIQPTPNNKVAIVNKKYATKPDFVVGDIAVGIMEGKLNEEEIKWNAVENAIINFLKMNTKILDKRVQAKDIDGVKGGLSSIIRGLTNAQRSLKLESVNEIEYKDAVEKFNTDLMKNSQVERIAKFHKKSIKDTVKALQPYIKVLRYSDKSIKVISIDFRDTNSDVKVHVSQTYKQNESVNEGKFKKDDLVYNKRTKTVGIVRLGDDRYGEVKTDADGNVNVDELEIYNPIKFKHQSKAKVAPSTEKEVNSRGLFNPFRLESVNEAKDDFVAKHGKSNILLKKGYKHHTADELEALYDKVGKLVKGLKVKDVNVVFEEVITEQLVPVDKKAVDAFFDKKPLEGKNLNSDGKVLKTVGIGSQEMYIHTPKGVKFVGKVTGRYAQSLVQYVTKNYKSDLTELVNEGRAFINAARKAKLEGKTEFEFNGKKYPVTIK